MNRTREDTKHVQSWVHLFCVRIARFFPTGTGHGKRSTHTLCTFPHGCFQYEREVHQRQYSSHSYSGLWNRRYSWISFGLPLDSLDSHISHASSDKTLLAHDWRRFCWQIGALGWGFLRHLKFHGQRLRSCHDSMTVDSFNTDIWACVKMVVLIGKTMINHQICGHPRFTQTYLFGRTQPDSPAHMHGANAQSNTQEQQSHQEFVVIGVFGCGGCCRPFQYVFPLIQNSPQWLPMPEALMPTARTHSSCAQQNQGVHRSLYDLIWGPRDSEEFVLILSGTFVWRKEASKTHRHSLDARKAKTLRWKLDIMNSYKFPGPTFRTIGVSDADMGVLIRIVLQWNHVE
jgi:hypothetical protein